MAQLENNESIVSWLAPMNGDGSFAKHIPAVRYEGKYWTVSLRMSKSIYRNVRLRQGFKNVQIVHGVQTLRIPQLLFNEKQRTQARFKEMNLKAAPVTAAVQSVMRTPYATARTRNTLNATHLQAMVLEFYKNDAERIIRDGNSSVTKQKARHLYADIGPYMNAVCEEIHLLFPSAAGNHAQVLNIMRNSLLRISSREHDGQV